MRELTLKEIQFVKETHFTPTVYQCNEYERTPFKNFAEAKTAAREQYGFDLLQFISKNLGASDDDGISLEYTAAYIFYCFFNINELVALTPEQALKFLQDYRYFCGFRKWDEDDAMSAVQDAIDVYDGFKEFYTCQDKNIWWKDVD